jgi:hypothetical protein
MMMESYLLTVSETWVLSTLLHLPIQPGSVLIDWMHSSEIPESPDLTSETLSSLAQKKYYFPANTEQPFPPTLLSSLALASVNPTEITLILRRVGQASMTRFAQVGNGLVQFGMDEQNLALHPVISREGASNYLFPTWFTVNQNECLQGELPLGAFLLFKQACVQTDLAYAESGFSAKMFKKIDLLKGFTINSAWVDVFNAESLKGVLSVDQMPVDDYFNMLVSKGFLQEMGSDLMEIGKSGEPLAAALSDADLCSLTLSLQIWEGGFPQTDIYVHGGERLFLLHLKPGIVSIQQLESPEEARLSIDKMLFSGSQAHYKEYVITSPQEPTPAGSLPHKPFRTFADKISENPVVSHSQSEATIIDLRPSSAEIIILNGELENQHFPINDDQLRIGREVDNDLSLPDKKASRNHATIQQKGMIYQISDLNSGNGTYVNGKRISQPTVLQNGDTILIGTTQISFNSLA